MIKYTGKVSTRMANLTTAKLLLHRTVSTPGERFMCFDIKKFYLGTSMERYEYIQTLLAILPKEIVEQYNLTTVRKGRICVCGNPTGNVQIEAVKTNCK